MDAYCGPDLARRALSSGETKAGLPFLATLLLGILAGVFIALGSNFFTVVMTNNGLGFGAARILGGVAFSLGLILVVVGGAELFTGNTLIIMAWMSGRVSTWRLLRNWVIVYIGNFIGSIATALLVFASQQYTLSDCGVGAQAVQIAAGKVSHSWGAVLASGIMCNILVCLAVWLCYSARSTTDRILSIVFPVAAFVAGGFEHCVANMYLIPMGIFAATDQKVMAVVAALPKPVPPPTWGAFVFKNLIPATLGNIIGGAIIVGAIYWFAYLLPEHRQMQACRKEES
jgi:formate/nitrite transporter